MTEPARISVGSREALDLGALAPVYAAAFSAPPYSEPDARDLLRRAPHHAGRSGFAIATASVRENVVGFAYGLAADPESGWIAELRLPPGGVFELVELAVHPEAQGRGTGAALLGALLRDRPERRVALQTHDGDGPAIRLYERAGFRRVGPTRIGVAMVKELR